MLGRGDLVSYDRPANFYSILTKKPISTNHNAYTLFMDAIKTSAIIAHLFPMHGLTQNDTSQKATITFSVTCDQPSQVYYPNHLFLFFFMI